MKNQTGSYAADDAIYAKFTGIAWEIPKSSESNFVKNSIKSLSEKQ